jgi:Aspartate decarboxylase
MLLKLLKSKIHRATVTRADLNYEGGFEALMRANPKTSGAGDLPVCDQSAAHTNSLQ